MHKSQDISTNLDNLSAIQINVIKKEISQVINQIVDDWNSGNLEGFMNAYGKSDKTLFISGDKFIHGWQNIYNFYKQKYGDNKQDMGKLHMKIESIETLSISHAFLYARWNLILANKEYNGVTSLIFQIENNSYKILLDHSN